MTQTAPPPAAGPAARWRPVATALLVAAFLTLCLRPYLAWARDPSLFDDDLTRVGAFRRYPVGEAIWRPFNEHVAPLFELVGWLAWWGSGRRVEAVAGGLLAASYAAWLATLAALGLVLRRELGSPRAAGVGVAVFAAAPVAAETVLWYSASSFGWAAAAALVAWYAAARATGARSARSRAGWLAGAAGAAAASPLCSAIGALAGPLACLRLALAGHDGGPARSAAARWAGAATPLLGTAAYAALVGANRAAGGAVAASVRGQFHPLAALWAAARAPAGVLLPGVLGRPAAATAAGPDAVAAAASVVLVGGAIAWAARGRHRAVVGVGVGWVVGGYLLAYATRARPGDRWVLEVGRYHLFPLVGAACWAAAALGPPLDRLARRAPLAAWGVLVALAAVGTIRGGARVDAIARQAYRYPDQGAQVAAALRLEAACRANGVGLAQAIRVVDPVEPRWFPRPLPFHPLLYLFGPAAAGDRLPDAEARAAVLRSLVPADREAIFGGVDAARYRRAAPAGTGRAAPIEPPIERAGEEARIGAGRTWFAEYPWPAGRGDAEALALRGVAPGARVEVWWAGADGAWDPGRSVRWTGDGADDGDARPLVLPLLPHWRAGFARRFRVVRRGRPAPTLLVRPAAG